MGDIKLDCNDVEQNFDYKDVKTLDTYLDAKGRIKPRTETGLTPKQQKQMATVVKRVRFLTLLPYSSEI